MARAKKTPAKQQSSNKDLLLLVESMAHERGVAREKIFAAVESALAAVAAKPYGEEALMRVAIDRESGNYDTFRVWHILSDEEAIMHPDHQMALCDLKELHPDSELTVGDILEIPVESMPLRRIGAQLAKQVMLQKVREEERSVIANQYERRVGDLVTGVVKRVTRDYLILDMGNNAEALLTRDEMIPREAFRVNDRVRAYLFAVRTDRRGPQLLLSRIRPEFLKELFKIEVPEIGEDVIEIKAAARDPGSRAKIAVKTNDGRIDPIGACVGMRGSRVQAVSNELNGERVDIVLWDDNPAQLVINAMAPAEVASIVADEDSHTMDIAVNAEQLSQAIGRSGQNVKLASELTGWTLNVMSEADLAEKHEGEANKIKNLFIEKLAVDEEVADVLVQEGFTSLDEIAYVPAEELQAIEGFDADVVAELQQRAGDILLTQEIAKQETLSAAEPAEDLLAVEGMTDLMARELATKGVATREDLAEQSVDDLLELIEIDEEQAAQLIMAARAHWFE